MTGRDSTISRFLSLVVPAYNMGAYIEEFLDSVTRQTLNRGVDPAIEMIVVDDGSTDDTASIVRRWMDEGAWFDVRYVRQDNRGPSAARNLGIGLARGEWVTWPDSDDVLRPEYLEAVLAQLEHLADDVCLAAARILVLKPDRSVVDSHPLRRKFHQGSRVVDLEHQPEFIQLQAASAFYRRWVIERAALRLDPDIRPTFEDAYFTAMFLDAAPSRKIALIPDAHYLYRRHATSLVQRSWSRPEKYDHLPRVGYLRLLETFAQRHGVVPAWVQNLVLYDLFFYFREDARLGSATAGLSVEVRASFHDALAQVFRFVDDAVLAGFSLYQVDSLLKETLAVGYKHPARLPNRAYVSRIDWRQQIAQIRYVLGTSQPSEMVSIDGEAAPPLHAKVRDLTYFGKVLAHERIVWVPATATLRLWVDGRRIPLEVGLPREVSLALSADRIWRTLEGRRVPRYRPGAAAPGAGTDRRRARPGASASEAARRIAERVSRRMANLAAKAGISAGGTPQQRADARLLERATGRTARRRFDRAWVFMDRDTMAQDNAEHLYRWVRREHPSINAWFVLSSDSPDHARLEREGFRLVDPASQDYVLLLKNAQHRISSQTDEYVVNPLDVSRFGRPGGRFTFLQHGVIHSDLSRWLNDKPISLMVTTTHDEHESIVGDHTPYLFTTKEVALIGMPRHDRLLSLASEAGRRPYRLLLAPTWRNELVGDAVGGNRRRVLPGLWESDQMRPWGEVMGSEEVQELARRAGLVVSFLPHPNLDAMVPDELPGHVDLVRYRDGDVQQVLADTALLVTDYSSLAFEMALLVRPVIYLQHGGEVFTGGGNFSRPGRWSFEHDGFGPVVRSLAELLEALRHQRVEEGRLTGDEVFGRRAQEAFPFRDGRNCQRVYERILQIRRPAPQALLDWQSRWPTTRSLPTGSYEPSARIRPVTTAEPRPTDRGSTASVWFGRCP